MKGGISAAGFSKRKGNFKFSNTGSILYKFI